MLPTFVGCEISNATPYWTLNFTWPCMASHDERLHPVQCLTISGANKKRGGSTSKRQRIGFGEFGPARGGAWFGPTQELVGSVGVTQASATLA